MIARDQADSNEVAEAEGVVEEEVDSDLECQHPKKSTVSLPIVWIVSLGKSFGRNPEKNASHTKGYIARIRLVPAHR
jgi:hypothetical protein